MFNKIVTLSLNPAIDATLWIDKLESEGENVVSAERYDAAGKAMNVSRALRYYGVDSTALVLAGRYNLERYESRLRAEKVNYHMVLIDDYIRENISIVQENKSMTRIMRPGFCVKYEAVDEINDELAKLVDEDTVVVISGSLPRGISPEVLRMICDRITSLGGKVSLDTASVSLKDIQNIKPYIVKPNYLEACALLGKENCTISELVELGKTLNADGIEHVLISLSADGMLYIGEEKALHVHVPVVTVVSSIGAGDCALAGFLLSVKKGGTIMQSIAMAAAMGTATCLTEGTNPPPKLATANILQQLDITEVE